MAIYEIDTLKSSLKKYTVILAAGVGIGLYLSNCAFKPTKKNEGTSHISVQEQQLQSQEFAQSYRTRALSSEEQRLQIFESYIRK